MTLLQHIQEVSDNIALQDAELVRLHHKRKASILAGAIALSMTCGSFIIAGHLATIVITSFTFALVAIYNALSAHVDFKSTVALWQQNVFYRKVIIDESYSGENCEVFVLDQTASPSANAVDALPAT